MVSISPLFNAPVTAAAQTNSDELTLHQSGQVSVFATQLQAQGEVQSRSVDLDTEPAVMEANGGSSARSDRRGVVRWPPAPVSPAPVSPASTLHGQPSQMEPVAMTSVGGSGPDDPSAPISGNEATAAAETLSLENPILDAGTINNPPDGERLVQHALPPSGSANPDIPLDFPSAAPDGETMLPLTNGAVTTTGFVPSGQLTTVQGAMMSSAQTTTLTPPTTDQRIPSDEGPAPEPPIAGNLTAGDHEMRQSFDRYGSLATQREQPDITQVSSLDGETRQDAGGGANGQSAGGGPGTSQQPPTFLSFSSALSPPGIAKQAVEFASYNVESSNGTGPSMPMDIAQKVTVLQSADNTMRLLAEANTLGKMAISVHLHENGTDIAVATESAETARQLTHAGSHLAARLEEAGARPSRVTIELTPNGGLLSGFAQDGSGQSRPSGQQAASITIPSVISGAEFGDDAGPAPLKTVRLA